MDVTLKACIPVWNIDGSKRTGVVDGCVDLSLSGTTWTCTTCDITTGFMAYSSGCTSCTKNCPTCSDQTTACTACKPGYSNNAATGVTCAQCMTAGC